ncbi:hypothetical protein QPK87_31620 [Kamptonema cortianum]|nr:hypothetical protein [Kamptonema cortianum]
MFPIFMVCLVVLLKWTIMGDVEAYAGILAILALLAAFAVGLGTKSPLVQGCIVVTLISLMLMFPFAQDYLNRHDLWEVNVEKIDRAHEELAIRPDNIPAWFALARSLYEHGYRGHGIALAEMTLDRIPSEIDPVQQRSMRDFYRSEEYELKKWKRESAHPKYFKPLPCRACRHMNRPGFVNCEKCNQPFLLEMARGLASKGQVFGKLILAWAGIAVVIPFSAWAGVSLKGFAQFGAVVGGIAGLGLILFWLLRPPSGSFESRTPFS